MPTEHRWPALGVLTAPGRLPLLAVIATAAVACPASDHLLYAAARVAGPSLTGITRSGSLCRAEYSTTGWSFGLSHF